MANQEFHHDEMESQESLEINKETVQDLDVDPKDQENVKGGWLRPPISWTCPQASDFCATRTQ